jgi:putative transposase
VGTWDRVRHFAEGRTVLVVSDRLLRQATAHDFEVLAYCFMADHVHALVAGCSERADLPAFVSAWKQQTGFLFARTTRTRLWQPGYFERVLRDDETSLAVARYIMENPLRAGWATRIGEYPHAWCVWGSDLQG